MSRRFGGALYGRLMSLRQTVLALAMAAGALRDATGSYCAPYSPYCRE